MMERSVGRPKTPDPLDWRRTVRLTEREGAWLEQQARRKDIPVAILLRHIVREYEERHGDGREREREREQQ